MFSIYLDKVNPSYSSLMIGSYDFEGSSYFNKLSLVKCKSAETFEVDFTSISIGGSPVEHIKSTTLIIDP